MSRLLTFLSKFKQLKGEKKYFYTFEEVKFTGKQNTKSVVELLE